MYNKLLEFQKKVTPIVKDSSNPFYKSKYFDINSLLETIRPILNELGLIITQPLITIEGRAGLQTVIIDAETGKRLIDSTTILPENNDPQKMGATITYFRRYSLQSMLCLEAEDDDGNTASGKIAPAKSAYTTPPTTVAKPVTPPAPVENSVVKTVDPMTGKPWQKWADGGSPRQKVEGQPCPECGGKFIKGKTGTIYCGNKCWLAENAHFKMQKPEELPANDDWTPDEDLKIENIPF